ncbi:hypothetical protein AAG570_012593, partial [Ranatra chinensis]
SISDPAVNKSLSVASTSSVESLASLENEAERTVAVLRNDRTPGAFTSYIRRRGEPDGKTASSDALSSGVKLYTKTHLDCRLAVYLLVYFLQVRRPGGGESDAAFTPSPPVAAQISSDQNINLKLAQQARIRYLYNGVPDTSSDTVNHKQRSPDSSSSSSATDWDNSGHTTVLRRLPPLPPVSRKPPPPPFYSQIVEEYGKLPKRPQNITSERLSVRSASLRNPISNDKLPSNMYVESHQINSSRLLYLTPEQEQDDTTPAGAADTIPPGIQDQIRATQLTRLNRELTPTISEVYHERNIGLGLAPPLTKLLLPQNNSNDLSVIDAENKEKSKTWLSTAELQRFYSSEIAEVENKPRGGSPCSELSRRDEGDGRSIADSQCSAGSYKRNMRQVTTTGFEESTDFIKDNNSEHEEMSLSRMRTTQKVSAQIPNSRSTKQQPSTVC